MINLFKTYIYQADITDALLVGQNIFLKNKGNKEIFTLYFDLLLSIADNNPASAEKYLEQAVNVLSMFSENVDISAAQVQYIRDCEVKLTASVTKMEEYKHQERVRALKKIIENNDRILGRIKDIIKELSVETVRESFDELLVEMSARDLELDKDNFVERQRKEYDLLTKKCQQVIDAKFKEYERLANVKYNQEALASYEKIFRLFKDPANNEYHANQIIELFMYDASRLFNETLVYYNHVYNYVLSKLNDEEKLSITKLAIITEKKR